MDVYSTSFNVYPFANDQSPFPTLDILSSSATTNTAVHRHQQTNSGIEAVWDTLNRLSHHAMTLHPGAIVSFTRTDDGRGFNLHINGPYHAVMAVRGLILRQSPVQNRSTIRVTRQEILESPVPATNGSNGNASVAPGQPIQALKQPVIRRLDEIAAHTRANISVLKTASGTLGAPNGISHSSSDIWSASGLEAEKMCELIITGPGETVGVARARLLVMLDEMTGLHAESIEIDYKLHPIIAGRKRHAIQTIQEETATNIYFPPLPLHARSATISPPIVNGSHGGVMRNGSASPESNVGLDEGLPYNPNVIWITGEFFGVQRARDSLYALATTKVRNNTIISRETAILPRKLDWMQTTRLADLKQITRDQGTYIKLPEVGSLTSLVTIYGETRQAIDRTIKAIMALAAQYYVASFWLLPVHFNVMGVGAGNVNPAAPGMVGVLRSIACRTAQASGAGGAEVVFKSNCFEMHGLESEVRMAVQMILNLEVVKNFHHEIRFQLELANEHRDFISGKKNGKINKIMSTSSVKIKFETFNEHNFLIDVAGTDANIALHGLTLLQEELPAEIAFHVPEVYHKRIIGVGGRSIQRIMKKYGVYVKFNSADEVERGGMDDEDNVLARTPAKNAGNLENLKGSVMELVNPKDKDYVLETVAIPRRYHRSLFGEKSIFLRDIEAKTNSKITFPGDGLDFITIFGPENQVHIAAAMVLDHVPFEADLSVPPNSDLNRIVASSDFLAFNERIKREYQVAITPYITPGGPSLFRFRCQRSNSDVLATAREMLEAFLISNHVHVYAAVQQPHKPIDSFADAFPHFNSKLLSTAISAESPELARQNEGFVERRIRMASSTPDVKALFNSPSYVSRLPEQEEPEEENYYSRPPSYGTSSSGLNDYWNPARISLPNGIGAHGLPPPGRVTAAAEEAYKRGSDSLLEAKFREKQKLFTGVDGFSGGNQRLLTTRAQSLDLTSLSHTSRGMSSSMNGLSISESPDRSESPTDSGTNPSPPPSAMIPSFPSVYGPSSGIVVGSNRRFGSRSGSGDDAVNEMESAFSSKFTLDTTVH